MATKIRFITSANDEMTTKKYTKFWPALKLLTVSRINLSIDEKKPKKIKIVNTMNIPRIVIN